MANIKSAKKRVLVNEKKAAQNQMIKSAVKTEIKKVRAAVEAGNKEEAAKALLLFPFSSFYLFLLVYCLEFRVYS